MKLLQRLVEYVAPASCLSCGAEGSLLCQQCSGGLAVAKRPTCFRCNRLTKNGQTCPTCRRHTQLSGATVAAHYDGVIKQLILELKFNNATPTAQLLAGLLAPLIAYGSYDVVVSVPTTAGRYRQRGYNQSRLIARSLASRLGLSYRDSLRRLGHGRQLGHSRRERLQQLRDSIVCRPAGLAGARVLLVDDIMTTGATMAECAAALKAVGAKSVWGAVVAKH